MLAANIEVRKFITGKAMAGSKIFCLLGLRDEKCIVRFTPIPLENKTWPTASLHICKVNNLAQSQLKINFHPIVFPSKNRPLMNKIVMIMYGRGMIIYTANFEVSIPSNTVVNVRIAQAIKLIIIHKEWFLMSKILSVVPRNSCLK